MVRLQKFLADAGLASRRASEQIIRAGRVWVNGRVVAQLGTKIDPVEDRVTVDGERIKPKRKLYVAVNKPRGYLCTRSDSARRPTLGELLPKEWQHLYSVGRLDNDTEGLIFLTNDGQFSLRITHPRYGTRKTYRVTVAGRVEPKHLEQFKTGVMDQGERLHADGVRLVSANNTCSIVELDLTEGKNREVRRLCAALGLEVSRLQRTKIGPIRLGELPAGKWRTLTEPEIKSLLQDL